MLDHWHLTKDRLYHLLPSSSIRGHLVNVWMYLVVTIRSEGPCFWHLLAIDQTVFCLPCIGHFPYKKGFKNREILLTAFGLKYFVELSLYS